MDKSVDDVNSRKELSEYRLENAELFYNAIKDYLARKER